MRAISRGDVVALFAALTVCLAVGGVAQAQSPTISGTTPLAVKPGASTDVTITGGGLAGITKLWTNVPGTAELSPTVKDNGKNAAQAVYKFTLPADAPCGVYAIRAVTPSGVSPLRLLVIDDLPTVAQQGANHVISTPQVVTLPVAVDGAMPSLNRSYYKFKVTAGQRVSFEVLARRIGSPLDPMIRLLDLNGREIAYSDDALGLSADPQLSHVFAAAGEYLVEVSDIQYRGGGNYTYRLRMGDFPCVNTPYPLGAKRGTEATVTFAGSDVEGIVAVKVKTPTDPKVAWINVSGRKNGGQSSGFGLLSVGATDEAVEIEPNDDPKGATRVVLGANINGRLEKPGDVDRFVFAAKKGAAYVFKGVTRRQGAPTDLYVRLFNAQGAKLSEFLDAGTTGGAISYTFPADGDYTLVVEDLHHRGGSAFAYRIAVTPVQPGGFSLDVTDESINVPAGGTAMLTVNATRSGHNGPISVVAIDLPAGVTSVPTVIGAGTTSVVLTLTGTPQAVAGAANQVRVVGRAKVGTADVEVVATANGAMKAAFNQMPYPPPTLEDFVSLGIAPKPQLNLRIEPAQVVFGKLLPGKFKVIADRTATTDEAITLAITPAKGALPAGITVTIPPIPKGKNEVEATIAAAANAPMGEFTAVFVATHKKGAVTLTLPTPGIGVKIDEPLKLSLNNAGGKLKAGGTLKIKVVAARNPSLTVPIAVTLNNLPKGVTASAATIPAGASEVEVTLTAAATAAKGAVQNVAAVGNATVGAAKFSATSANTALTVE